jgi:putative colanic acid biosynthesis acetyltransferase WcaF
MCGAKIGKSVHIYPHVNVKLPWNICIGNNVGIGEDTYLYSWSMITIEDNAVISHRCQLCSGSHDCNDPDFPVTLKPIHIGKNAWICTEVFIGPGVTMGDYAVASAGAVLYKSAKAWGIYVGNPAKRVGDRTFEDT